MNTDATHPADASPEKRLFIFLLTRDISLVDAFLDLIDNSINAAIISRAIKLETPQDYVELLQPKRASRIPRISITLSSELIEVTDNAGGISFDDALSDVFRFGRDQDVFQPTKDRLSVYGIGLKRAIFKMGNKIDILSNHRDSGFSSSLDVSKWQQDKADKWTIPISRYKSTAEPLGTSIRISELRADVKKRIEDPMFSGELIDRIKRTYIYFLNTVVSVTVNNGADGKSIDAVDLSIGENFASDNFEEYGVACRITAGLARSAAPRYSSETAGWYVFCNGRAVTYADKTQLTGWGTILLPLFQPKHRPFLGLVFFVSRNPEALPWTTTKTHINEESLIWQSAKRRMSAAGRNVTSFLDKRYSDDGTEITSENLQAVAGKEVRLFATVSEQQRTFSVSAKKEADETTIQYKAKRIQIAKIKQYLGRRSMSNSEVGRFTFDHFLKNEVGE